MNPIRYEDLQPNLGEVVVRAGTVEVHWLCPASGRSVGRSSAGMAADPSLATRVGASVKRSIANELIYGAAQLLSRLLGGAAGRVVSSAAYTAASEINQRVTAGVDYSEDSRRAAIVAAFDSVRESFEWNEQRRQFVARVPQVQGG